jgi:hypothetical protein
MVAPRRRPSVGKPTRPKRPPARPGRPPARPGRPPARPGRPPARPGRPPARPGRPAKPPRPQGYNARKDEQLGMTRGKQSGKGMSAGGRRSVARGTRTGGGYGLKPRSRKR